MKKENESKTNEADVIERYVYDVTRRIPTKQRSDIEQELRGLIEDMLTSRTGGAPPSKADVTAVLTELGRPSELAAKYRGSGRYLIGPEYFDVWLLVAKIVTAATAFGITVAFIVGLATEVPENVWAEIGQYLLNLISAAVQAFAWVTLVFAVSERTGTIVGIKKMKKGFRDTWKPADLPQMPAAKSRIRVGEPVFGIVITVALLVFLNVAPELIGIYIRTAPVTVIPIFDLAVWHEMLWLIDIILCLGILKEVFRLLSGKYTLKLAAAVTAINIAVIVLTVTVFLPPAIWNSELVPSLRAAADMTWAADTDLEYIWSIVPKIVVGLGIFGNAVDILTSWVRGARNAVGA